MSTSRRRKLAPVASAAAVSPAVPILAGGQTEAYRICVLEHYLLGTPHVPVSVRVKNAAEQLICRETGEIVHFCVPKQAQLIESVALALCGSPYRLGRLELSFIRAIAHRSIGDVATALDADVVDVIHWEDGNGPLLPEAIERAYRHYLSATLAARLPWLEIDRRWTERFHPVTVSSSNFNFTATLSAPTPAGRVWQLDIDWRESGFFDPNLVSTLPQSVVEQARNAPHP